MTSPSDEVTFEQRLEWREPAMQMSAGGGHSGQSQQLFVRSVGGTFEDRQGGTWLEFHGGPEGQVGETEAAWGPSRVGGVASRRKWHLTGSLAFR